MLSLSSPDQSLNGTLFSFQTVCIIRTIWFDQRRTEQATSDRCVKETGGQFASKELDFLSKEQLLGKDQLSPVEKFLNGADQFATDRKESNDREIERDQSTGKEQTVEPEKEQSNIHATKPELVSMWPDGFATKPADKQNNGEKYNEKLNDKSNDKFANFNDSFNSSPIDKTAATKFSSRRLFNSKLQKHHSFDQAFDHSFDRIRINSKLNCIKEQNRPELTTSSLKIELLHQPIKKSSCIRVNSQGIIPKARIKTLQMTCVIITGRSKVLELVN